MLDSPPPHRVTEHSIQLLTTTKLASIPNILSEIYCGFLIGYTRNLLLRINLGTKEPRIYCYVLSLESHPHKGMQPPFPVVGYTIKNSDIIRSNQQRVFAIQVFELHRLIEVQKLFASSPHLLLDSSDIITIHPKEPTKSLPVSSTIKYQQIVQQTDHSTENLTQNSESLMEKTASMPLQAQEKDPNKELSQFPRNVPPTATTHPIPSAPDNRVNPWPFPPPPNQWLIPVMSPSEGLIYKPYAGPCPPPGFMSPLYGACGPLNIPSVSGDFVNSRYVFPSSHLQQHHILPGAPPVAPNYIPSPYGMPIVNPIISTSAVEQINPLTNVRSNGRSIQCSQSSCNISIKNSEALSGYPLKNKSSSKDNEIQASTASSPFDKVQGEGRDFLPGFLIPPASEGSSGKESQTHVIKVIPHNARSASESAARIFRSIQRERRQNDL